MKNKTTSFVCTSILLLLLAACQFTFGQPATPTPTSAPTGTSTQTATLTPSLTRTPRPTATSILPELAMTLTPYSYAGRQQKMFNRSLCDLPCWWNITPGSTTWEDAQSLLEFLGFEPRNYGTTGEYTVYEIRKVVDPAQYWTTIDFYLKQGVVDYIHIESRLPQQELARLWSVDMPKNILEHYGPPANVMISADDAASPQPYYSLVLVYHRPAFEILYSGFGRDTSSGFLFCPDFSKGIIDSLDIYLQSYGNFPEEQDLSSWQTLNQATGLSIEEFYNLFVGDNPLLCFTVKK